MNRRSFLSTLAALPVVGRYLKAKPRLASAEMLTSGTTMYAFGGKVCRMCKKPGHQERADEVEYVSYEGMFGGHGRMFVRRCETYPINEKIYRLRFE